MTMVRAVLAINPLSPAWLVNTSWGGRVTAWVDSFQGGGWGIVGAPVVTATRADVFLTPTTGAPVTDRQLADLKKNWSGRVGGVSVHSLELVQDQPTPAARQTDLERGGVFDGAVRGVGALLGDTAKALAVPIVILGTVAIVAYFGTRVLARKG